MFIATGAIGGALLPTCSYTYTSVINATASTFTFGSASIGTASAKRYVVVGLLHLGSTPVSVTCNGVAMTALVGSSPTLYVSAAPVTTGTTASIVFTQAVSTSSVVTITVWAVYNIRSNVAYSTANSTASPAALSLNVPPRTVVIGFATSFTNGANYTWTGITEDFEQTSSVNNMPRSGAHEIVMSGSFPLTVSCSYSASAVGRRGLTVSLR